MSTEPALAPQERRRLRTLRLVSIAPLALMFGCVALIPSWRSAFVDGWFFLRAGDVAGLRELGAQLGAAAALFTTLLMITQALAAPIPAVVVTAANSLLFGPFVGGCLSVGSATLAAWLCFVLARAWGRPIVARMISASRWARADAMLETHGASTVLAARLMPFVPFDPISYLAGLSRMRAWTFVWATLVGQIPAGFAYSYLAQDVGQPLQLAWKLSCALAALALLAWVLRRAFTARAEKS